MFERLFIASISQRTALYLPNAICLDCASRGILLFYNFFTKYRLHTQFATPSRAKNNSWGIYRTNWMILQRTSVTQPEIRKYQLEKLSFPGAFCLHSWSPANATLCNSCLWFVTTPRVTVLSPQLSNGKDCKNISQLLQQKVQPGQCQMPSGATSWLLDRTHRMSMSHWLCCRDQ